jgi:predicted enzyme related to lactoylglutathione lyase
MVKINGTNVTIMAKSMDASIKFYESIGLTLKQRWGDNYAMMETAGLTIGIHPGGDERSNSGTVSIGFMIDNIEDVKAMLDKNNITARKEDDGKSGIYCHFNDPDGTVLYFVQPKW